MTAKARVLSALRSRDWVWGVTLAHPSIGGLRYGARLHDLRADGFTIDKRPHPGSAVPDYRLDIDPEQLTLADWR